MKRMMVLSVLVAVALGGTAAAERVADHAAVTPEPRDHDWWRERHEAMNERVAQGNVDLLFIGDSITQGWEGAGREVWDERYAERNAVNLGIGGDRTQHVLWRLDNGNIEGISPKAAVIMIGTNNSNGEDHTAAEIADGIAAIVGELRGRLPEMRLLLLGIFPRGEEPNDQRGKVLQTNQIARKLADDEPMVHYLDIGHHFIDERGVIPPEIMPDFLHLTPEGYAIWASAIEEKLAELLGE